jgi:hypothetical protein
MLESDVSMPPDEVTARQAYVIRLLCSSYPVATRLVPE